MYKHDWFVPALVAALLMTFAMAAHAVRYFPLHSPIVEEGTFLCMEKDKAIDVVRALIESGPQASNVMMDSYVRATMCGALSRAEFVYKKQVFRGEYESKPVVVFEATVGKVTVYVPMIGWLPEPGV